MNIIEFIKKTRPVDVAKAIETNPQTSTRDRDSLLKKAALLERFANYFGKTIKIVDNGDEKE